jgi:filamentous hemagglutinin
MSYIQQFFTSRDNNANAETFVGQEGRLWWDPITNQIYSSDGNTPGGIPLAGGGGGNGSPGGLNGQVQFNQAGNFGGSANLTFNSTTGTLTAVSIAGNGAGLTNITGSNVVGEVANATYATSAGSATTAGTVTTNAQPNITSVGTLTTVSVSGNVQGGNLRTEGVVSALGRIISSGEIYSATQLTGGNISGANIVANGYLCATGNVNATGNISGGNLSVTGSVNLAGRISAVGNITGGNILTGANVSATSNITGGNLISNGVITTVGNVVANYFVGNGAALFAIAGANVTGTVANATYAVSAGSATTAATVTTNAQPNITSVGTLTSIASSGNISTTGNVTGNYFVGNGSQLTGISTSSNRISNGTSNVEIATANGNATITTNGANTWTFDTTGNLTLPGNLGANNAGITSINAGEIVSLKGQANGTVGIKAYGSAANLVAGVAVNGSDSETDRVTVSVFNPAIDDNEYWSFNTAGDFTTGTGNIFFGTSVGDPVIVPGSTSIKIAADRDDVTSNYISIGSSGIIIDALGGSSADIRIRASDDVFIAGGDKTANPGQTGGVINIDGGQGGPDSGVSAGDGGDVNIQGGRGGDILAGGAGDGGEVFIGGGSGSTANVVNSLSAGAGAPVTIYGGEGGQNDNNSALSNRGGNVDIYGGQGSFDFGNSVPNGDPGHVNIYGGNWGYVAPSGNIYFNGYDGTNIKTLTYDNAGNVTMAAGGSLNFVGSSSGIVQSPNNNLVIRVQDDENAAWSLYNRVTDAGNTLAETKLKRDSFSVAFPNGAGNWTFNTAGNVVFPDTTVQTTAYPGTDTTLSLTGNIGAGNVSVSGAFYGNFYAPGVDTQVVFNDNNFANADAGFTYNKTTETVAVGNAVSASNVSVTNTISGNVISATGNVTGANLNTAGAVRSTGSINLVRTTGQQGEFTFTDGVGSGFVVSVGTGLGTWAGAGSLNLITSSSPGANIGIFVAQTERARFTTTGLNVSGVMSASSNVTGGNILTGGLISATANITGGNVLSNGQLSTTGNITGGNITVGGAMTAVGNIAANWVNGAYYTGTWGTNFVSTGNVSGTNITTAGLISAAGNITGGNLISTGAVYSNYNTNTANTGSFMATGGNTKGGTGYLDFLVAQNTSGGATNPYKWFRTTSDGQLQIINSAYTTNIFNLSDAGAFSVPGPISISGKQAVNGPAFSAYAAAILQNIPNGTQTKVLFQTEEFDTNNNYASSRFTPTVEGYYQLNAEVRLDGASGTGEMMIVLYKNGSEYKRGTNQSGTQIASSFWAMQVSSVAYANGSTDYFEIYVQQGSGGTISVTAVNAPAITWFNGCMLRGA